MSLWAASAHAQTFSNTTPLDFHVPAARPALYPSTITVPGGGVSNNTVRRVAVTLRDFSHDSLVDVNIALRSPNGRIIPLMAGNFWLDTQNADVTFFAEAANVLPNYPFTGGIYLPTTNALPTFPAPAPTGTAGTLAGLTGTPANGIWSLYVFDSAPAFEGGSIAGGWSIEFVAAAAAPATTAFTYQGKLDGLTSGTADLRFTVWDSLAGTSEVQRIGTPSTSSNVAVSGNLFTTLVNVGQTLPGDRQLWLQVEVASPAGGAFVTLSPRQLLTAPPVIGGAWNFTRSSDRVATTTARVGVGVLAPAMSLEVGGPNSYYGAPALGLTSGANWFYTHVPGGTNNPHSFIWNNTSALRFGVEPTKGSGYVELARITPTGNVGLGTQTPSAKLDVVGNVKISGTSTLHGHVNVTNGHVNVTNGTVTVSDGNINITGPTGNAFKPGGGAWLTWSDPRLKHDAAPLKGTLDRLLGLRGYQFLYNDEVVKAHRGLPGLQIGLMADEVERVFPDWVTRDDQGMRMVTERSTTALMVEALRDLRAEKDAQIAQQQAAHDAQLAQQRAENAELKARLERLEQLIEPRVKK